MHGPNMVPRKAAIPLQRPRTRRHKRSASVTRLCARIIARAETCMLPQGAL